MKKNELASFQRQLLELQQQLSGEVGVLRDETRHETDGKPVGNLSNIAVEDRAERGSDNTCDEATIALLERATTRLQEIQGALERVAEGSFGKCAECGRDIAMGRLESSPFVARCIECARTAQQGAAAPPGNL